MKTKAGHQNRFVRIITIPFRALRKAKNMYVRSMSSYANKVGYGTNYMGTTSTSTNYATPLPKSFSFSASRSDDNEDLRDLIRAASVRSLAESMDINHLILEQQLMRQQQQLQRQQMQSRLPAAEAAAAGSKGMPPRSSSVGMARIDEEKPYAAGESFGKSGSKKAPAMYPRSKSYAVNKRSLAF